MDSAQYFFFTGGGTVLKAIEEGTPYGLEPVKALIENGGSTPKNPAHSILSESA
jgi:phosphoglycerate kinase